MPVTNEVEWKSWEEKNKDPYGKACVDVAREVMKLLDEEEEFDCHELINRADDKVDAGGITGFMAGCVARMVANCHSRGEEFRVRWNKGYAVADDKGGVVNPAILTIKVKE